MLHTKNSWGKGNAAIKDTIIEYILMEGTLFYPIYYKYNTLNASTYDL